MKKKNNASNAWRGITDVVENFIGLSGPELQMGKNIILEGLMGEADHSTRTSHRRGR